MGIKDLSRVISDHCPNATKTNEIKAYFGRKIAIDASMSLYQFLIAIRQDGSQLANSEGEITSHLNGMFYRTIRMMENGIKPIYVFDGKPPEMKADELDKRTERRNETEKSLDVAIETGDKAEIEKLERRLVKVSKEQNEECKKLLRLMGIPVIDAPGEAEAQCAELVRMGKAYASATEDMDALTFGSKILVRYMTYSEAKKQPIKEYILERILSDLSMTMEQFVDLCILLGCDYCPTIRGVGPKKAFELIVQHKSIEKILENIDLKKYTIAENWKYAQARELFLKPDVTPGGEVEFEWSNPKSDEIITYLCGEKGFNEARIKSALERLQKSLTISQQGRIDTFFKPIGDATSTQPSAKKKKLEEEKKFQKPSKPKSASKKAAKKPK